MDFTETNKALQAKAETIVRAVVVDWTGKVLFETTDYWKALDFYEEYLSNQPDEGDNIFLSSYDKEGTDHGIFY